jgi:integrase
VKSQQVRRLNVAREVEKLTQADVRRHIEAAIAGTYTDGAGLALKINANGAASWTLRYTLAGKQRERGLGSATTVDLKEARRRAKAAHAEVHDGKDVIAERRAERATAKPVPVTTFRAAAEACIANRAGKWDCPITPAQWAASLERYAYPVIGTKPVADVTLDDVDAILRQPARDDGDDPRPIWVSRMETANRVLMRLRMVLDYAIAKGWRPEGSNPARIDGPLQHRLPGRDKKVEHHAALPHSAIPSFMERLRARRGVAAKALEFLILSGGMRSDETRGTPWGEIDMAGRSWFVPGPRMKGREAHTVPLSDSAMALLEKVRADLPAEPAPSDLIFPGPTNRRLSDVALSKIARLCAPGVDLTVHGFRTSFRGWAAGKASWEACEHAIAHKVKGAPGAYIRPEGTLDERRRLLQMWGDYCDAVPAGL